MKRIWKLVTLILLIVSLVATTIVIYGYKHFWFSKYDKVIKNDNNTVTIATLYRGSVITRNIEIFPNYYREYKVSVVAVTSDYVTKIVLPEDLEYFDIGDCPKLEEIVMPESFESYESYIAPSHKEKVTLIVKENSKAKQYAIDNGYKYRIEE